MTKKTFQIYRFDPDQDQKPRMTNKTLGSTRSTDSSASMPLQPWMDLPC